MTQNQATLFFLAEYGITAVLLIFCYFRRNALDVRKTITRKTFLKRLPFVLLAVIIGIGGMTGTYLLRLDREMTLLALGGLQLCMTVFIDTLLFASWIQRFRIYPRGKELVTVIILMYAVADLFMPSGIKYAILVVGTAMAVGLPNQWGK